MNTIAILSLLDTLPALALVGETTIGSDVFSTVSVEGLIVLVAAGTTEGVIVGDANGMEVLDAIAVCVLTPGKVFWTTGPVPEVGVSLKTIDRTITPPMKPVARMIKTIGSNLGCESLCFKPQLGQYFK